MASPLHSIAELVLLRSIDSLILGTVVCMVAAVALRILPRQNATTRFSIWFSTLLAAAVLPWFTWSHPALATSATRRAAITVPDSWAIYFLVFWSAIALWLCVGIVRALWYLNILRRNCVPVNAAKLDAALQEILRHGAGKRAVDLYTCDKVRVPIALGLFKPAILIPSWVMNEFSAAELNQVVLHELAHFRRWDDWTNLIQQVVKALLFFHPAVWWLDKRVAVEREIACDDAVLEETASPRAYAECLAHLAERILVNRTIALAQAALGKIWQTSVRVARILDGDRPKATARGWRIAMSMIAVFAVGCAIAYSKAPKLIAFEGPQQSHEMEVAPAHIAATSSSPVPVTAVNFKTDSYGHSLGTKISSQPALISRTTSPKKSSMVRAADKSPAAQLRETFVVVVESGRANPDAPQMYQIQMWRVTVVQTVIRTASRPLPPKQT